MTTRSRNHTPEAIERVIALRKQGYTYKVISQRTGIPEGTIIDWFRPKKKTKALDAVKSMVNITGIECGNSINCHR